MLFLIGGRRRNFRDEEKEPEWFTGGPTSQTDTIELRGFEKEKENPRSAALKGDIDAKNEKRSRNSVEVERNSKGVFFCMVVIVSSPLKILSFPFMYTFFIYRCSS